MGCYICCVPKKHLSLIEQSIESRCEDRCKQIIHKVGDRTTKRVINAVENEFQQQAAKLKDSLQEKAYVKELLQSEWKIHAPLKLLTTYGPYKRRGFVVFNVLKRDNLPVTFKIKYKGSGSWEKIFYVGQQAQCGYEGGKKDPLDLIVSHGACWPIPAGAQFMISYRHNPDKPKIPDATIKFFEC